MKPMKTYWIIIFAIILSACGGSGGQPDTDNAVPSGQDGDGEPSTLPDPLPQDPIANALTTGNAAWLDSKEQALDLAIEALEKNEQDANQLSKELFQNDSIVYQPGKGSNWINTTDLEHNISLVVGNNGKSLAAAGVNQGRYAAFGSDIVRNHHDFSPTFSRLIRWLIHGDISSSPVSPTIAIFGYSFSLSQTTFNSYFTDAIYLNCSVAAELADCAADADLIIFGSDGTDGDAEFLQLATNHLIAQGKGILYSHTRSWNENMSSRAILTAMNMQFGPYGGNFWDNDAASWSNIEAMLDNSSLIAILKKPLLNLRNNNFDFDYSNCTTFVGQVNCQNIDNIETEFFAGARLLKNFLNNLDNNNQRLFDMEDSLVWKYMTLYADKVRAEIEYPMDKLTTEQNQFYAALYADHGVHYHRTINGVQSNLGTFSDNLNQYNIDLIDRDIQVDISKDGGFTAMGLYALPGQEFTISRSNALPDEKLWIKINTQRTGSSRYWNTNQYDRPAFLQSSMIPLLEDDVLSLSTPYGGTLQLISEARNEDTRLTLSVTNLAQHAVLTDIQHGQEYINELNNNPINWTELKTPLIEIHSLSSKMLAALNGNNYHGDVTKFFNDIDRYMIKSSYNLAGFTAPGLSLNTTVQNFCDSHQWICIDSNIHRKPAVQHINVDKYAHCGGGCAGNPYDQSWNLNPLGWGESHEIGHNLQRTRLKIEGNRSNEVSNQIFPIYKNVLWKQETGESLEPQRSKYEAAFNLLKMAANTADPMTKANELLWQPSGVYDNNGERITFFMQLVHLNEGSGFSSAWDVYTLSYLLERQFTQSITSDALWQTNKDKLGFSTYNDMPNNISGNDFMLIAHSFIAKKDLRPIWDLWGISYSSEASHQIDTYNFPSANKVFYYSDDTNNPSIGNIEITPEVIWPLSIP